jgi:hypothetical protein
MPDMARPEGHGGPLAKHESTVVYCENEYYG